MSRESVKCLCRFVIFVLISLPPLLYLTENSTILINQYKSDYVVFSVIGEGWIEGKIPYKDLFDHKGPLMFLIQAIGHSIGPGKWGVFILEILCAAVSFEIIYRCGNVLKISNRYNYLVLLVCYVTYFIYLQGGNTVEEWSLPFQLISLLVFLSFYKYFINCIKRREIKHNKEIDAKVKCPAFIFGLSFGLVSMIRINNNCIICGLLLSLIIYFLFYGKFKALLNSTLFFLLGLLTGVIPFVIYFAYWNALDDMIYGTFVFNYYYKLNWTGGSSLLKETWIMISPTLLLPIISFIYDYFNKTKFFIPFFLISIISFIIFFFGARYPHYYFMLIPITALSLILSYKFKLLIRICVFAYALLPCYIFRNRVNQSISNIIQMTSQKTSDEIEEYINQTIPQNDLDSIYIYNSLDLSYFLEKQGHLPQGSIFFNQKAFGNVHSSMKKRMENEFLKNNPKWILSDQIINQDFINPYLYRYALLDYDSIQNDNKSQIYIYKRL